MFRELTRVFGETVVYGITGVASTIASVFLVPFYTRVLTPADYGVATLLGILFTIIGIVANMGMSSAVFWAYFKARKEERGEVISTSFVLQTVFPIFVSLITFVAASRISGVLFGSTQYSNLIVISAVALFFNSSVLLPLSLLRAEGIPSKYTLITVTKLISTVLFSLVLVIGLRMGLLGVFMGNLIGAFLGYLLGLIYTLPRIRLAFSGHWAKEMLNFGLLLMPAGLAAWVLNSSDRYFLNFFVGTADVGIYNVGYKVGMLVNLVSSALLLAYPRFMFSIYNEKPNPKDYFKKISTYFYLITFSSALFISVFSREVIEFFTGSAFHGAYIVVPLISFSYVANGLYQTFITGAIVNKKTYVATLATFIAGGLNIVLNYVLIARFGMMGAAFSTLISFAILALVGLGFSQKVYSIPFEFRRILMTLGIGSVLAYASTLVNLGLVGSIMVKSLILALFPFLLYLLGFFEEREVKKLSEIWNFVKSSKGRPRKLIDILKQEFIT